MAQDSVMVRALIIDSQKQELNGLKDYLKRHHFQFEADDSWESAGKLLQTQAFEVIISARELPENQLNQTLPVILLTDTPSPREMQKLNLEAIPRKATPERVVSTIEKLLLIQKLARENHTLREHRRNFPAEPNQNPTDFTQQNQQFELINSLILVMNQLQNLNEVLRVTSKELFKLFRVDVCFIHLWERPKGSFRLAWLSGEPDKQKFQVDYLKKNNVEWWQFIKKHQAIFIDQDQTDIPSHPLGNSKYKSIWYLPLVYKRKLLGLVTLGFVESCQIPDELKRLLHLICFQIGMTIENIQLKQEQARRSQEIQERNEELRSFIYTVSHDLKSPLVALYGFADLLQENYANEMDETGQDFLKRILMNSELMHRMIDDLLELSRIGRVLGPRIKFSTRRLLEELGATYEYQMRKKNITLSYPKKMPIIYADRERIATVFQNLLTNSIKYCRIDPTSEIRIDWVEEKKDYLFSIADNGIGINPLHKQHIFDLFKKFGDETRHDGTGVGLTIAKKILEHHGGKIWVESTENVGTTFFFTIPKYSQVHK
jgi:signal transduction histidine kinase